MSDLPEDLSRVFKDSIVSESPEKSPQLYDQLIFNKGSEDTQYGKGSLFNKWCWENWAVTCKRIKLAHFLTSCGKVNKIN